nr:MAG TPA: hypothetical protein [Caudoviricetes sp.]
MTGEQPFNYFHPFSNRCNAFQLLSFFTLFLWM